MQNLNFPSYSFRFKNTENKPLIFDEIRKKFVQLNPEEWVRQHLVKYLIHQLEYPKSHINVEKQLLLDKMKKRYDIVVFNTSGAVELVAECKAPNITIDQAVFDQIARYNMALNARYLVVSNGLEHFACTIDTDNETYHFLKDLPKYQTK